MSLEDPLEKQSKLCHWKCELSLCVLSPGVCHPGWLAWCPEDLYLVFLSLRESLGALYGKVTLLGLPILTSLQSVWSAPKRAGKAQPVTDAGGSHPSSILILRMAAQRLGGPLRLLRS